jgi:hypothetical protein
VQRRWVLPASWSYAPVVASLLSQSGRSRCNLPSRPITVRTGRLEFAPPLHIGEVTEGTTHGDPRALVGLGSLVRQDRHLHAENRAGHSVAEERLVALIIGVGNQGNDGRDEFGRVVSIWTGSPSGLWKATL